MARGLRASAPILDSGDPSKREMNFPWGPLSITFCTSQPLDIKCGDL